MIVDFRHIHIHDRDYFISILFLYRMYFFDEHFKRRFRVSFSSCVHL